ncbi:NUDIX domain-containing protein [Saccharopolyspora sp. K220]|uniref:NUDIX domain-containing protein n=1 Tax=Saccharopolyspora soli TaxID=2926618 RepID=UPI001F5A9C9A|nr:NUDIX domain-containing protein [Saccharopolyspora soli]MCI2423886.1 NUDIX domain-containing protein [Saccharopolyspora soli]
MTEASVTADLVLIAETEEGPSVLLVWRAADSDAYPGAPALPGGYLNAGETFRQAAIRECAEETGVRVPGSALVFVGIYDAPERDPRGRVVSGAFAAVLDEPAVATAADDADATGWVPVRDVPFDELAFDHDTILRDALIALKIDRSVC